MEIRKVGGIRARWAEEIYTYCAFWIAVSTLPALAFSYVGKLIKRYFLLFSSIYLIILLQ